MAEPRNAEQEGRAASLSPLQTYHATAARQERFSPMPEASADELKKVRWGPLRPFLRPTAWRRLTAFLVFLASLAAAGILFPLVVEQERRSLQQALDRDCTASADALQSTFNLDRKTMRVLTSIIMQFSVRTSPPSLTNDIYKDIAADTVAASLSLTTLAFSRLVKHSERAAYEEAQRFPILDYVTLDVAPPREEYLVVEYAYTPGMPDIRGLDMMGLPDMNEALDSMLTYRVRSNAPPVSLGSSQLGLRACQPLFSKDVSVNSTREERRKALMGILGTQFRFWKVRDWLQQEADDLVLKLVDVTSDEPVDLFVPREEERLLHRSSSDDFKSHRAARLGFSSGSYELWCRRREEKTVSPVRGAVWSCVVVVAGAMLAQLVWMHVVSMEHDQQEHKNAIKLACEIAQANLEEEKRRAANSTFLASVTREISTPMNGVLGMLNLLLGTTELTPVQSDYVETALSSGQALLSLVNDILDHLKAEAGCPNAERIPLSTAGGGRWTGAER